MEDLVFRLFTCLLSLFIGFLLTAGEVFLLNTADLHGIVNNTKDAAGAPSVLAAISEDADRLGRDKTLLIDCGDLLQGSLESSTDQGKTIVRLLNAAKFDIERGTLQFWPG